MEAFAAQHPEAVVAALAALAAASAWFVKREFMGIQRYQDRQDDNLKTLDLDVRSVVVDLADSKRDRRGLHGDIAEGFKALDKRLDLMDKSNKEAHDGITALIRNGGA